MGFIKQLCFLILIITTFFVGIFIFANGFLLTRHEMTLKSSCESNTCWTAPEINKVYSKAIVIIIDALRFDFAEYKDYTSKLPYINKLPVLRELAAKKGCSSARLFRFQADAPTTTMQRIKGFTTGSFPTFVDISNNFDSSEITEDNIIDQIVAQKSNITFLGDDTWLNLFPGRFSTALPFPSFDVKDLHTVDNGILNHLYDEMQKPDWKFIIAHFLGVDHCGHRYGPVHPEMTAKLGQMNEMIQSVVEKMTNDTLLVIMGDHGMTETGDHGGATVDEVDTTLFVYSPPGALFSPDNAVFDKNCYDSKIQQVDIVPTLSLLFGFPIPFPNLGSFIPALITGESHGHQVSNLKQALTVNLKQVQNYLQEYNKMHSTFPQEHFQSLITAMTQISPQNFSSVDTQDVIQFLRQAREMCHEIWAQFNEILMSVGLQICATVMAWYFLGLALKHFIAAAVILFFIDCMAQFADDKILAGLIIFYVTVGAFTVLAAKKAIKGENCLWFLLSVVAVAFYGGIYTANSFILTEDNTICYLFTSMQCYCFLKLITNSKISRTKLRTSKNFLKRTFQFATSFYHDPFTISMILSITLMLVTRYAFTFRVCRPEQFWCYKNSEESFSAIDQSSAVVKPVLSTISLVGIVLTAIFWFKKTGNSRGLLSPSRICARNLIPIAVVCITLHWVLQTFPSKQLDSLPDMYVTFLPRCAFVLLLSCTIWWLISPITSHLIYPDHKGRYVDESSQTSDAQVISEYYHQLKQQLNKNVQADQEMSRNNGHQAQAPPAAFGLYTFASTSILGMGEVLLVLIVLLLDVEIAPVMFFFILSTGCLLEVISMDENSCKGDMKVSWVSVFLWSLSSSFWWFATGHQGGISSIPWNAAFVGFRGNHPTVALPAVMVTSNIFSSQILHTALLPLVVLWPITRARSSSRDQRKFDSELDFVQSEHFWPSMTDLFMKHILFQAVKMLGCMTSSFLHRRHLMVWWIFAPRYLYESVAFIVTCICSVLCFCYLARIKHCMEKWIHKKIS
uniref:GPI ethanolamine phosphate transferase 3-like n=1 Tax=Phallusia mammillata TaxID=59560 RepID=A0A6F9DPG1_9ASCI|nr:GPI ethanolamine phosphate transferase 3-like [Phallusia mammillata]